MKYGITVAGKVTEPVNIPSPLPSWAQGDVIKFLEKMFPGKTGWKQVNDDAVPGTTDNGDGTFTNPPQAPAPPVPEKIKTQAEFESWAIERLGSVTAWQTLLEKCAAQPGATAVDVQTRYFPRWTSVPGVKTKAEFEVRATPLTLTTPAAIISPAALANALSNW
jgi:hypothetical protein